MNGPSGRISLREVRKSFDHAEVLRGIDLDVPRGQFLALMGESGSGKSTLLNIVSGIETADAGSIEVEGISLRELDDDGLTRFRRKNIGFVFQFFNLLEYLTVQQNVEVPLLLASGPDPSLARARALDMLERVGIPELASRRISGLSGGERQRVAVARALVHQPRILIADEPTGSLDSRSGERVLGLMKGLAVDLGVTVLMATHSATVSSVADRVVTISDGRLQGD